MSIFLLLVIFIQKRLLDRTFFNFDIFFNNFLFFKTIMIYWVPGRNRIILRKSFFHPHERGSFFLFAFSVQSMKIIRFLAHVFKLKFTNRRVKLGLLGVFDPLRVRIWDNCLRFWVLWYVYLRPVKKSALKDLIGFEANVVIAGHWLSIVGNIWLADLVKSTHGATSICLSIFVRSVETRRIISFRTWRALTWRLADFLVYLCLNSAMGCHWLTEVHFFFLSFEQYFWRSHDLLGVSFLVAQAIPLMVWPLSLFLLMILHFICN